MQGKSILYTIGYSGFPDMEDFLDCLKRAGIRLLIDVRSTPYSQYHQQYDKPAISEVLKKNGIQYRNYSREFGARQEDKSFHRNGRLDFGIFVQSPQFLEGVKKVHSAIRLGYTPVLMCAEKEPATCHRAIMIARFFYICISALQDALISEVNKEILEACGSLQETWSKQIENTGH